MGDMGVLGQWLCLPRFGETGRGASWVRDSSVRCGYGIRRPLKWGEGEDTPRFVLYHPEQCQNTGRVQGTLGE